LCSIASAALMSLLSDCISPPPFHNCHEVTAVMKESSQRSRKIMRV
jgi:hypothetical protein